MEELPLPFGLREGVFGQQGDGAANSGPPFLNPVFSPSAQKSAAQPRCSSYHSKTMGHEET